MLEIYEDRGTEGQLEFVGSPEYDDLYVLWRMRNGKLELWLADEGDVESTREGPVGWRREAEELLADRLPDDEDALERVAAKHAAEYLARPYEDEDGRPDLSEEAVRGWIEGGWGAHALACEELGLDPDEVANEIVAILAKAA